MKNPLFIPKSFKEIKKDNSKILYSVLSIQDQNIRVMEYYDEKGIIKKVNIWGICRPLVEKDDCYIARDDNIVFEKIQELKPYIESHYPKGIEMLFF